MKDWLDQKNHFIIFAVIVMAYLLLASDDMYSRIDRDSESELQALSFDWVVWDKKQILSQARTSNQHILLNVSLKHCQQCAKMENRTYRHQGVQQLVKQFYIPVKITSETQAIKILGPNYDYSKPVTVIMDARGAVFNSHTGFIKDRSMEWMLQAFSERRVEATEAY